MPDSIAPFVGMPVLVRLPGEDATGVPKLRPATVVRDWQTVEGCVNVRVQLDGTNDTRYLPGLIVRSEDYKPAPDEVAKAEEECRRGDVWLTSVTRGTRVGQWRPMPGIQALGHPIADTPDAPRLDPAAPDGPEHWTTASAPRPACCCPTLGGSLAEYLYAAYNAGGDPVTAGLNYRGEPCPVWADLPENVRAKWEATADVFAVPRAFPA